MRMKLKETIKTIFGIDSEGKTKNDYAVDRYHRRQWCPKHNKRCCMVHGKHKAIYSRKGVIP